MAGKSSLPMGSTGVLMISSVLKRCVPKTLAFAFALRLLGKRKHTPPCSSEFFFFAGKNGGHRGKISVVDMILGGFVGFFYPPPVWKVSLFEARKVPQKIFFWWWVAYVFFFSGLRSKTRCF